MPNSAKLVRWFDKLRKARQLGLPHTNAISAVITRFETFRGISYRFEPEVASATFSRRTTPWLDPNPEPGQLRSVTGSQPPKYPKSILNKTESHFYFSKLVDWPLHSIERRSSSLHSSPSNLRRPSSLSSFA